MLLFWGSKNLSANQKPHEDARFPRGGKRQERSEDFTVVFQDFAPTLIDDDHVIGVRPSFICMGDFEKKRSLPFSSSSFS